MTYYYLTLKQNNEGVLELSEKIDKDERRKFNNYFIKSEDKGYFLYLKRSNNAISIYKIRHDGRILRMRKRDRDSNCAQV